MQKIKSFTIDHTSLERGIHLSRRDAWDGAVCTTLDVRLRLPNREPALTPACSHTIEHIAATLLRNDPTWGGRVIYWGPMGCLTGFYLILWGEVEASEAEPLLRDVFRRLASYEGEIPGCSAEECGNWRLHSLEEAREAARQYLREQWTID
ncbi:MAG: S-ribosylhomocysteine lyase [Prevotellaceae bacterium]|nr:S-ribosylhomocysteine lyase [Prevotellaceae bacterium]